MTYQAIIWMLIGIIFNTKGLVLGSNGYFFSIFYIYVLNRVTLSGQSSITNKLGQVSK